MNEEIEKLLNKVNYEIQKHINQGYDVEMLVPLEFDVSEWTLLLSYIEQLQNNWNELKKYIGEQLQYYSLCEDDYKEFNILDSVESKMQELGQGSDK